LSLGVVLAVVCTAAPRKHKRCPSRYGGAPQAVPGFWDPRRVRSAGSFPPHRDPVSDRTDYPPFNFNRPDGNPAGSMSIWQAALRAIKVSCTIQMRRFETLLDAITATGRCHHRVAGGDTATARRVVSPIRITGAGAVRVARDGVMPEIRPNISRARRSAPRGSSPRRSASRSASSLDRVQFGVRKHTHE